MAPRVEHLHLLDPSPAALDVAKQNLHSAKNVSYHCHSVANIPLPARSLDFAFSLGVLHHVPDTQAAIAAIADKLKPNAPFLIYLYYALDNRPIWYRLLWRVADLARFVVSRLPHPLRLAISQTDCSAGLLAAGALGAVFNGARPVGAALRCPTTPINLFMSCEPTPTTGSARAWKSDFAATKSSACSRARVSRILFFLVRSRFGARSASNRARA